MPTTTAQPTEITVNLAAIKLPDEYTQLAGIFGAGTMEEHLAWLVVTACQEVGQWSPIPWTRLLTMSRALKGKDGVIAAPTNSCLHEGAIWLLKTGLAERGFSEEGCTLTPTQELANAIKDYLGG